MFPTIFLSLLGACLVALLLIRRQERRPQVAKPVVRRRGRRPRTALAGDRS